MYTPVTPRGMNSSKPLSILRLNLVQLPVSDLKPTARSAQRKKEFRPTSPIPKFLANQQNNNKNYAFTLILTEKALFFF